MAAIPSGAIAAARRYGRLVDPIARGYVNPVTGRPLSGEALLLKLSSGENHFSFSGVSSAGARGPTQFTAGSRAEVMRRFGLDPWKNYDQAFHATALHLLGKVNGSKGLEGYNPGGGQGYVKYILGQRIGHVTAGQGSAPAAGGAQMLTSLTPRSSASTATEDLISNLLSQRPPVPVSAPAAPATSAAAPLPKGYVAPSSSGGPQPKVDIAPLLAALQPSSTDLPGVQGAGRGNGQAGGSGPLGGSSSGRVIVDSGANRKGAGLQRPVLNFLDALSAASRRPVTVTTGTNHNEYVLGTNRVSDHWGGNAADLGVGGDARQSAAVARRGDFIAAHAIALAAGIGFDKALAMARRGGVFNFKTQAGRVQILWRTNVGGDHFNHVHIGVNPGR